MKKTLTLALICLPALILQACEDDPILSPNVGGKKAGGSYGNVASAPPTDTVAPAAVDSSFSISPRNPELF